MLAGNTMAIGDGAGARAARIGSGRGSRLARIVFCIVGLVAFPISMVDVRTGGAWTIGMLDRALTYPIMVGHVLLGSGLAVTPAA